VGPNARGRTDSLNCPREEGSTAKADSHVGPADYLQHARWLFACLSGCLTW
jgi:hypothetical protein